MVHLLPDRRGGIALLLLLTGATLLYLITLDNGIALTDLLGGDLITHQYAQVQARPSNAPGYPLYTMGGWVWFHMLRTLAPAANPVAQLSSYSTLWAVLALALLFVLLYHLTDRNLVISLGLSVFYAITYFFWFYAVTTEQYTSAVLHTLLIIALVHVWDRSPRDRYLYALAFLLGLALAHMVTVLFVAPGVLAFILWKQPGLIRRGKLILVSMVVAFIPLLSYTFIYQRGAQYPEWRGVGEWPTTWSWFISFISTQQGRDELTWTLGPLTGEFPSLIWLELTPLLLLLGMVGWALMGRRYAMLYGMTALIYLVFSYIDRYGNWYQVILPLYPLVLLGAGVTLNQAWHATFVNQRSGRWQWLWRASLTLILLGLILAKFASVYPRADQRNRAIDTGLDPAVSLLADDPPRDAAVVAESDLALALDYVTTILGVRPDVEIITTSQIPATLDSGRPLLVTPAAAAYAARESGLALRYSAWSPNLLLASAGDLAPIAEPALIPANQVIGDGLNLTGLRIESVAEREDGLHTYDVLIQVSTTAVPSQDWSLSLRPLANGNELSQQDHTAPALGYTPTTSLKTGEAVRDAFRFHLPLTPSADTWRLILYRPLETGGFENLFQADLPATP